KQDIELTAEGERFLAKTLQISAEALAHPRRPVCKAFLDWSERRHHLAGTLGAAMMTRFTELKWAARDAAPGSRVVNFTRNGEKRFAALFGNSGERPLQLSQLARARQGPQAESLPSRVLPISKTTPAERPGMPAGRAVKHRAASTIGTTVPAGAAATRDADGVGRHGLVQRSQRHRLGRHRHQAEANGKRR